MKITKAMGRGALLELKTGRANDDATDGLIEMSCSLMLTTKNHELLASP